MSTRSDELPPGLRWRENVKYNVSSPRMTALADPIMRELFGRGAGKAQIGVPTMQVVVRPPGGSRNTV